MRVLALVPAMLLLLSSSIAAQIITVPTDQPTIQAAFNAATNGDTIIVLKGTYTENVVVDGQGGTLKDDLTVIAKGATIDGATTGSDAHCFELVNSVDGFSIQGMTFLNGDDGISISGNDASVTNCTFKNPASSAIQITGADAVATDNRIEGAGGDSIAITGDNALIVNNAITRGGDAGIALSGDSAQVTSNKLSFLNGNGLELDGTGNVVMVNKISFIGSRGIDCNSGTGCVVLSNTVGMCESQGIRVTGAGGYTVSQNKVNGTMDDGIFVDGSGSPSSIYGNKISMVLDDGIQCVNADGATVLNNSVVKSGDGSSASHGINIDQCDGLTAEKNKVTGHSGNGIRVDGNNNTLRSNSITKSLIDGILVFGGNVNFMHKNKCSGNGGEGLDNRGTNTALSKNTFLKNGSFDIANDDSGGATMTSNDDKFGTGGTTGFEPRVD